MYCCVLAVGHFVRECEGVSRKWRTGLKFTAVLTVGHFVRECEGVSREWRTELKCTAVCWQLDILCWSVRQAAGSDVLN